MRGMKGLSKKEIKKKETLLMDTNNSVVIARRWLWMEVEEGVAGINGDGTKRKIIPISSFVSMCF